MISPTAFSKSSASLSISALRCSALRFSVACCSARFRSTSSPFFLKTSTVRAMSPTSSRRSMPGTSAFRSLLAKCFHHALQQHNRLDDAELADQVTRDHSEDDTDRSGNDQAAATWFRIRRWLLLRNARHGQPVDRQPPGHCPAVSPRRRGSSLRSRAIESSQSPNCTFLALSARLSVFWRSR